MPNGLEPKVGIGNSVIWPLGVTRPMAFDTASFSVNQRLPSGPSTISLAEPEFEGIGIFRHRRQELATLQPFDLRSALATGELRTVVRLELRTVPQSAARTDKVNGSRAEDSSIEFRGTTRFD